MMKKRVFILILLSFVTFFITAGYKSEMTRHFDLQAGYESAWSLNVEPIPAQSLSYVAGMPFSIEDPMVLGKSSQGREIATWSVLSNHDFRIRIYGSRWNGKMYPIDASTGEPYKDANDSFRYQGLDYILTFTYRLGYVDSAGQQQTVSGDFQYRSSQYEDFFYIVGEHTHEEEANAFIGSVDGSIFFRFDEQSVERIVEQQDTLPPGDYMAYVTIELENI